MSDSEIFEFEFWPEELHLVASPANKINALLAKSTKKGIKMKMSKENQDLLDQLDAMKKQVQQFDRTGDASRSLASVAATHDRAFGRMGNPFSPFEDRVAAATADLQKARTSGTEWEVSQAKQELLQAKSQLTSMKMIAAENARQRDPATINARLSGRGIPMLSNRHALRDDNDLRYQ